MIKDGWDILSTSADLPQEMTTFWLRHYDHTSTFSPSTFLNSIIVCHQCGIKAHGVAGNQHIERACRVTVFFQMGAYFAIGSRIIFVQRRAFMALAGQCANAG